VNIVFPLILCLLLIASLTINYLLFYNKIFAFTSGPSRTTPTQTIHASPAPTSTTSDTTPTPTVTSTVSPNATSTTPVLVRPGNPFLDDPMMSQNSQEQWDVINQPYASCGYNNGGYDVKVPANTVGGCSTNTSTTIFTNFIYEINMKIVSGVTNVTSGTRGAGIMFRYENQNGASNYGISFQQNGSYFMFVYNKQVLGATLGTGQCTSFHQGANQTNLIDIKATGSTIELFVNNVYVITATDSQFQSGYIGVQISTDSAPSEVVFSGLKVWKL
jgi:hypothetical protein